jgi:3',5'-cyclic AMP phosphodiesterase CpdA
MAQTTATWKFVIFHHPIYPSHPWRDTPSLREVWVPVFDKHGVDLVLQGHDHAYLRTYPMRGQRRVDAPGAGTTYVIAVSGDKYVDQPTRDYIAVGKSGLSSYQTIETDPSTRRLSYRAWTEDGALFDELVLQKPAPGQRADDSVAGQP